MKKFFSVFASWVLLLSSCTFLYADSITPEEFNDFWDDDNLLPNNVYNHGGNFVECNDFVRGCVRNAKQQITWSFNNPGDVEIRKMVVPTGNPWKFNIHLMVRGKNVEQGSPDQKICSVVVFDKSGSMWISSWWSVSGSIIFPWWGSHEWDDNGSWKVDDLTWWSIGAREYIKEEKWNNAVSWAIDFSNFMFNHYHNSSLGLVFFWTTATVAQELVHSAFSESIFDDVLLEWSTNIHDWLIKAGEMLSWADCDKKYIILMTDWVANKKMTLNDDWERELFTNPQNEGRTPTEAAIWYALDLKDDPNSIEIFTIWYWLENLTNSGEAINTLMSIASNPVETHYYNASEDNINDIFNDIWENQIVINNMKITSIVDLLWSKILWEDINSVEETSINITEEANITESWVVYSFPIRIDPSASWWSNTNGWLVMNYINSDWDNVSLEIPADMSSQIYWEQPKCDENSYPIWEWVIIWSDTFLQTRGEEPPANRWFLRWNNDSLSLTPLFMWWEYTDNENPGECKWTCGSWYTVNDKFNWCKKIEKMNTVNIAVSPAWFGTVSSELIVANNDSPISTNWNELTIWTTTVTATPATWDVQYTYEFSWRNLDDCGETITDSCTITAEFRQVNYIKLDIIPNNFEYWTVDVSSGYFYPSVLSIETSGNELYVYDGPIRPAELLLKSIATPSMDTDRYDYSFSSWDIPSSCNEILRDDCTVIANFERNVNRYVITFKNYDWTILQESGMEYGSKPEYNWSIPTKVVDGYVATFAGWNPEIDDSTIVVWPQVYTATFNQVLNTYTVVFDWNGATDWNMWNQNIKSDEATKLSKNVFDRLWYTFSGWNTKSDWNWTWYDDEEVVTNLVNAWDSITLYAQRKPNSYTIEFMWNWADRWSMSSIVVEYDEVKKLSKNLFEKDGYKFLSWNSQVDWWWVSYDDEQKVSNLATSWAVKLYAQWWINTYIIVFSWNDATSWSMNNQNMECDDSEDLNGNNYTKVWYTFSWWNTQEDWSWDWYGDEESVINLVSAWWEITLYAQWTPNEYEIEFLWNWATTWIMGNQSMVYDIEETLNKNEFIKKWYVFKWWNTKKDWSWKSYTDKASVKNLATSGTIVLYAQWWDQDSWWGYSWWWGWWGWWGWKENKDSCPDGDYSWDFYDKKCWTKVEEKSEEVSEVKPVVVTPSNNIKRCSIEWSKHSKEVNEAYVWACQNWIIKSDTIQGARLWEFLNRAEMAKIVTVFEMLVLDAKPDRNKDCSAFADSINSYNSEMRNYMITSCQLERMWIHTADHKPINDFMPKKFVSRAEFGTILSRILWWNRNEESENSSKYYVQHLNSLKWWTILSNINPNLKERRSYAVLMIYRAAKILWKA